ncbi:MAG TPA: ATP-binding protein [Erythrobacter sp.]|nr:ATP-binding protein [Erythrobacter sp.]
MKLLSRLSLAQQVMLIVATGLILAQALNFALSLRDRQAFSLENAAAPAISRLIDAVESAEQGTLPERRGPPRARLRLSASSPIAAGAARLDGIEERARSRLNEDAQTAVRDIRAAMVPGPRGNRFLVISVELETGQWLTARARGPAPIGPAIVALGVQTMVILAALLLPLLLLIRSVTRPLAELTRAADSWAADSWSTADAQPVDAASGPRDVRDLVNAVNDMKARIAQMLREKDVMLGAIGHDLRTPLTALRIQVELIGDEDQRAGMIEEIDRLSGDLENILSLARSSANVAKEPGDLVAIAAAVASDFRARGAAVDLDQQSALIALVDPAAIRRAITNLVDNAVRYGGKARIRFERRGRFATILVDDDGPGIPEAMLASATEAFVRIEPSRNRGTGGHGLGLAIVAAIARAHGGALRLGNRPEGGLRAEIDLPLSQE